MRGVSLSSLAALLLIAGGISLLISYFADPKTESASVAARPTRVAIEKIGVDAGVVPLGLKTNGELDVPARASDVGWYQYFPIPGEKGPAIMVGHLDSYFGPGVFARLRELKPGDTVTVFNEKNEAVNFAVEKTENVKQDNFPTQKVYGDIDYAGLRLITCSGKFNFFQARYTHNLVVFAKKID